MQAERSEQSAQAIAVGKRIYIHQNGEIAPLITSAGKITDLAIHNEQLVYCGEVTGVHSAIRGDAMPIASPRQAWNKITSFDGRLYGALDTQDDHKYGIWNVQNVERVVERYGPTICLYNDPILIDSSLVDPREDYSVGSVSNTFQDPRFEDIDYVPLFAQTILRDGDSWLMSDPEIDVTRYDWTRNTWHHVHTVNSAEYRLSREARDTAEYLYQLDESIARGTSKQIVWDDFIEQINYEVKDHPDEFKTPLRVYHECLDSSCTRNAYYKDCDYPTAKKTIGRRWCREIKDEDQQIRQYLYDFADELEYSAFSKHSIKGISKLGEDDYLIGLKSGRLLRLTEYDRLWPGHPDYPHVTLQESEVRRFPGEITAMVDVPADVMEGIRKRLADKERAKYAAINARSKRGTQPQLIRRAA